MRTSSSLLSITLLVLALAGCATDQPRPAVQWQPVEIELTAEQDRPWWEFPAKADFTHDETGRRITLEGYWTGSNSYTVRFAAPLPGSWRYQTRSNDPGLNGRIGTFDVAAPEPSAIEENPNLHGQIRIADNQRTLAHADGTPFFLLADTLWAGNTARAGLGENEDGPFFQYLTDRKAKGFTAVLMQMFHGFGDYPEDPTGHRNEGGHLFLERDFERLNPDFLVFTDRRWNALWERGWVVAAPYSWWGKTKTCRFEPDQARRFAAYLAVRYGAFNSIWAVSGEYQYAFRDCGWTEDDINMIAEAIQTHNPYQRPLSIHPSGQTRWDPPHGVQSSRPFNAQPWLDHHWLQTGQSLDRVYNIPQRAAENRALDPPRPVFCSEAFYERLDDPEAAYHARWQAWTAFLNGCAGYGYGAQGLWQFYDPDDPQGEPGKETGFQAPWDQAMAFEGSGQVGHVRELLAPPDWHEIVPKPDSLLVDGKASPSVTPDDISPPQLATIPGKNWLLYIPRGNAGREIVIKGVDPGAWSAQWLDPRTGKRGEAFPIMAASDAWVVPIPPDPSEDWVVLLSR